MSTRTKAARMKTLLKDETFKEVMEEIMEQQIAVFVRADSSIDERNNAHNIVCALRKIEDYFDSVMTDEAMRNRKNERNN